MNMLRRCGVSQELVRERGELEAKLARDYGAGDAFLPLEGRCFTVSVDKYQYEVCPYGSAQQKDGGMSTRCLPPPRCPRLTSLPFPRLPSCAHT